MALPNLAQDPDPSADPSSQDTAQTKKDNLSNQGFAPRGNGFVNTQTGRFVTKDQIQDAQDNQNYIAPKMPISVMNNLGMAGQIGSTKINTPENSMASQGSLVSSKPGVNDNNQTNRLLDTACKFLSTIGDVLKQEFELQKQIVVNNARTDKQGREEHSNISPEVKNVTKESVGSKESSGGGITEMIGSLATGAALAELVAVGVAALPIILTSLGIGWLISSIKGEATKQNDNPNLLKDSAKVRSDKAQKDGVLSTLYNGITETVRSMTDSGSAAESGIAANDAAGNAAIKSKKISRKMSDRADRAIEILTKEGKFSKEQAAGIVTNLIHESNLNPVTKGSKDHGSDGIGQWRDSGKPGGDRLTQLKKFAKSQGKDWTDYDTQVRFVIQEMATTEKRAGDKLRNTKTAAAAAHSVVKDYERPNKKYSDINSKRVREQSAQAEQLASKGKTQSVSAEVVPVTKSTIVPVATDIKAPSAPKVLPNTDTNMSSMFGDKTEDVSIKNRKYSDDREDSFNQMLGRLLPKQQPMVPQPVIVVSKPSDSKDKSSSDMSSMPIPNPGAADASLSYQLYFNAGQS